MADEKGNLGPQSESAEEVKERPKRRPVQRFIPPSMWTAPQSRIAPPNPADQPSSKRAETYFRRVSLPNMIDGPLPTRGQRTANLLGGVLGASIGFYLVFFHDFGSADHVFVPIRRFFSIEKLNPFAPSQEEKKWALERGIDTRKQSKNAEKIV